MQVIYDRSKNNLEDIHLKSGYYTFIYEATNIPEDINPQKLPRTTRVMGKSAVVKDVRINRDTKMVYVDIWLAENPVWLLYLAYLAGGILLTWGLTLTTGNLKQVVTETVNPKNLIIFLLIVLAFNFPKIMKAVKK